MGSRSQLLAISLCVATTLLGGCVLGGELITQQVLDEARSRRERAALPVRTLSPTPSPATPTSSPTATPLPGRVHATVLRVWDGSSALIEGGYSVRYIGVAAPGAGMFRRPVEPFGREAAERNVELVEGRVVEMEADAADVDSSGFMLRYVYVDGVMVNELLLREGLARLAPLGRNTLHADRLREAEAAARAEPINLWTLPTATPRPTATRGPTPVPPPSPTPPLVLPLPTATRPAG